MSDAGVQGFRSRPTTIIVYSARLTFRQSPRVYDILATSRVFYKSVNTAQHGEISACRRRTRDVIRTASVKYDDHFHENNIDARPCRDVLNYVGYASFR